MEKQIHIRFHETQATPITAFSLDSTSNGSGLVTQQARSVDEMWSVMPRRGPGHTFTTLTNNCTVQLVHFFRAGPTTISVPTKDITVRIMRI
jgi:hypothetical protein